MKRNRFVIIGSGWRAHYYVRAAKALPDLFDLCAMYCRTEEKAKKIHAETGVFTTTSEVECASMNPDFVVAAVSKTFGAEVSMHWMDMGYTVLCETPAGTDLETLNQLWIRYKQGQRLVIAEQYFLYPCYSSLIKLVRSGIIGKVNCLNLSIAHEYHGASLIRSLLGIFPDTAFTVSSKAFEFPVTETRTRYEDIKNGRISKKKRIVSTFEFENGQTAFYDFDSEQYHSKIRKNSYKIQGVRGEIMNDKAFYLNTENEALEAEIQKEIRYLDRDFENPNPEFKEEVTGIYFQGKQLYEPPFGLCGLSQDETAVSLMMKKTAEYAKGLADSPYPLKDSLQDAYMSLLMRDSELLKKPITSKRQIWMDE